MFEEDKPVNATELIPEEEEGDLNSASSVINLQASFNERTRHDVSQDDV